MEGKEASSESIDGGEEQRVAGEFAEKYNEEVPTGESLLFAEISKAQVYQLRGKTVVEKAKSVDDEQKVIGGGGSKYEDGEAQFSEADAAAKVADTGDDDANDGEEGLDSENAAGAGPDEAGVVEKEASAVGQPRDSGISEDGEGEVLQEQPLTVQEQAAVLRSFLVPVGEEGGEDNEERLSIILDYLHGVVVFADGEDMSDEQLSVLYSIAVRLFETSRNGRGSSWLPLVDSYSAFRNLILTASVGKTKILSKQEVEATVKHFANTFFRHYNVYEVAFTTERVPLPIVKSVVIDTALPFPSLADGEEVAAPKAQKEAEEDEEEVSAAAASPSLPAATESTATDPASVEGKDGGDDEEEDNENDDGLPERLQKIVSERVAKRRAEMDQEIEDLKMALEETTD